MATTPTPAELRHRAAVEACTSSVFWHADVPPATVFADLARACDELGITEWDRYGDGGAVTRVEEEVATLLGKPAAVLLPSGVMAQQAVLRVWCDRMASTRVAIPDLAHQLTHEQDGPRLLHGFRFEMLTRGRQVPTAAALHGIPEGLGAVQLELPLRDAGCLLPTWEELVGVSEAAHELGVPLHLDGARLWESQPFWGRPLTEVAALADSVYVSFYKGLGGLAGAAVAADSDVVDEVRTWRTRHGGTIFHLTPYAVSALVGLRDELPRMGEYVAWARACATALVARGLRVNPSPPHTNTFEVHVEAGRDDLLVRSAAVMERERVRFDGHWRPADVPGFSVAELVAHGPALEHDPEIVAGWFAELGGTAT